MSGKPETTWPGPFYITRIRGNLKHHVAHALLDCPRLKKATRRIATVSKEGVELRGVGYCSACCPPFITVVS